MFTCKQWHLMFVAQSGSSWSQVTYVLSQIYFAAFLWTLIPSFEINKNLMFEMFSCQNVHIPETVRICSDNNFCKLAQVVNILTIPSCQYLDYSITWWFALTCCKENPVCINAEICFMITQGFALPIRELFNLIDESRLCFWRFSVTIL